MTKIAEQLKHGAGQGWESLAEGWRELGARASGAFTRFWRGPADSVADRVADAVRDKPAPRHHDER